MWSAFEGQTDAEQSLENLMLRKLESGEDVGEVYDDYKEMLERAYRRIVFIYKADRVDSMFRTHRTDFCSFYI